MYLSCQKSCVISLLVLAACSDGTAPSTNRKNPPPGPRYSRVYTLESIDRQPVPAVEDVGPWGSTTYLSGTLTLDTAGTAVTVTLVRGTDPAGATRDYTVTIPGDYLIHRDSIEVGGFGGCTGPAGVGVMCAPNRIGVFSDPIVTLTWAIIPPTDPVYVYKLSQTH